MARVTVEDCIEKVDNRLIVITIKHLLYLYVNLPMKLLILMIYAKALSLVCSA